MVSSMSDLGGIFAAHAGSTYTWHVAQAQAPPQSASMPGIRFFTAPSITDQPTGTSVSCSLPVCSMYLIFVMPVPEYSDHVFHGDTGVRKPLRRDQRLFGNELSAH